jgi:exopolyphosphatase/guanosine-5'-triphosphate,3'-diphosphate pyrophosphatase
MSLVRKASIDLGTNTCLLLVAEVDLLTKQIRRVLVDEIRYVRLGQGVDQNRTLHPEAKSRTLGALEEYCRLLMNVGVDPSEVIAVATSQARDAQDGFSFFTEIEKKLRLRFRTLTGEQEAKYTFLGGLLPGMNPEKSAVIDIGGGSTEIVTSQGGNSLDIGSVRFTERYLKDLPVKDDAFWKCQEAIDAEVLTWKSKFSDPSREWLGVAGTVTTIAAWNLGLSDFQAERLNGVELSRGDVHRLVEDLKWRNLDERMQIVGIEKQRADVILAGSLILWRVMELLDIPHLRVSTRGLRYGVLVLDS